MARPIYKITYTIGYTESFYLQDRIEDLAKTPICKGWEVEDISDNKRERKKLDQNPHDLTRYIDKAWGLTKKRWATPGLMSKLDGLWLLIDMHNVHKITFWDMSTKTSKDGYTNSDDHIKMAKLIIKKLSPKSWTCVPWPVRDEEHLKELREDIDGGYERHIRIDRRWPDDNGKTAWRKNPDDSSDDDEDYEGGDDGWCTTELHLAYKPFALEAIKAFNPDEDEDEDGRSLVY
ncbi:uncharacterized protein J4E87_003207 [Alternaria ethzedia]|uniref:uncharacterized protein n=1 Tax=Alternaria ethzedia TaxID=181014 RepID=UPI0020C2B0C8|nr:uncharacterized protein J4E87_003207 [Alternaria ethzedia]KAI4630017.1 hypothetical protein J4E87_003207 [Alternaria ethzedia]